MTKYQFHKLRTLDPKEYFHLRWQQYKVNHKQKPKDRSDYWKERYRKGCVHGGISSMNAYRARKYRGKSCAICGSIQHLVAHHKNRNQSENTSDNILTLCSSCHNNIHLGGMQKLISKNR